MTRARRTPRFDKPSTANSVPSSERNAEQGDRSWTSGIDARERGLLQKNGPVIGLKTEGTGHYGPSVRPKLKVNEPGDKYEKDAERVADAVMRMPDGGTENPTENLPANRIQRLCPRCWRRRRQGKPLNCEECEQELQRKRDETGGDEGPPVRQAAEVTRGPGQPLSDRTQSFFEDRMGADFSDVRVHTGGKADRAARSINARAYTLGSDVVMRSGEYRPHSREGKRLLAHELTHVVQQDGGESPRIQRQDAEDEEEPAQGAADERRARPQRQGQQPQAQQRQGQQQQGQQQEGQQQEGQQQEGQQQQGQEDEEESEARQEWDAHPGIQHHFHCFSGCEDDGYAYTDIRPVYQNEGINNPAEFITNNIVGVQFFDQSTAVNQALVDPIGQVESDLEDNPPDMNSFGGFVPRRGGDGLSNHGLGRAVDVDSETNPFVENDADITVIEEVTGVDLGVDQDQATMRQASNTFQQTFNDEWVQQRRDRLSEVNTRLEALNNTEDELTEEQRAQRDELQSERSELNSLLTNIRNRRDTLDEYANEGFLNLANRLVDAFVNNGFEWGGDWTNEKDFMHFEIDPP